MLTSISGVEFDKRASGRPKDLADLGALGEE